MRDNGDLPAGAIVAMYTCLAAVPLGVTTLRIGLACSSAVRRRA